MSEVVPLAVLFFAAALLYSSVGHAGASGYLAAMALVGLAPAAMKPTALALNILVASIATVRFARAGCFSWAIFWPFTAASVPFAALGGAWSVPSSVYKVIVGVVLLFAAYRLFGYAEPQAAAARRVPLGPALLWGAGLGFLSGLTSVGGGIFLSPLLLFAGWATVRQTAGVSAAFILVNSLAGLGGHVASVRFLPAALPVWALAAALGGLIGSELGARRLAEVAFRRLLAAVLLIAGLKLVVARS